MKALAIDTSTFVMGIAIVDNGKIVGEVVTNLKKNHSIRLMPAIEQLMKEVEISPKQLDRIIVANGPGSYTGVRIGVTTAKTLAWSLGIPIIGVSSLEVLAQNGRYYNGVVAPIIDARRGQVFTGLYSTEDGIFSNIKNDRLCLINDWAQQLAEQDVHVLFLGNDVQIHKETIRDILGDKAKFATVSEHNPRPSELAMLGLNYEATVHIHEFAPNYLRLAEAEANWLKQNS